LRVQHSRVATSRVAACEVVQLGDEGTLALRLRTLILNGSYSLLPLECQCSMVRHSVPLECQCSMVRHSVPLESLCSELQEAAQVQAGGGPESPAIQQEAYTPEGLSLKPLVVRAPPEPSLEPPSIPQGNGKMESTPSGGYTNSNRVIALKHSPYFPSLGCTWARSLELSALGFALSAICFGLSVLCFALSALCVAQYILG
jgi:hypothetical protein